MTAQRVVSRARPGPRGDVAISTEHPLPASGCPLLPRYVGRGCLNAVRDAGLVVDHVLDAALRLGTQLEELPA